MARHVVPLMNDRMRERAIDLVRRAPSGSRVQFMGPKRSSDQNAKMWCMLSEIAAQVRWHGVRLTADDFKLVFLDALKRENRLVPNIDGNGFVNLGRSSSDLDKAEFSDLIELIYKFGAEHGVEFSEPMPARLREGADR
jgi:hypothetical protein